MTQHNANAATILAAKNKMKRRFTNQGVILGAISGLTFGIYGVIVGMGMEILPLMGAGMLIVPIIGSAITDTFAAIWLLIYNAIKGKNKELFRTIRTKPGKMIVLGALAGGPIANASYLIAIANAGATYAIPISALCPMVGAILSRIFFHQKISQRVALGMALCIIGVVIISYMPPSSDVPNFYLGIGFAMLAALGWGAEGAISSFGGSVLDPSIAINIRQISSGLVFFTILVPLLGGVGLMIETLQVPSIMMIIAIAGLSAAISFLTWYQANSMVGCAAGMALNITYVFWGVVFAVLLGSETLTMTIVVGGTILLLGALIVSVNPLDFFKSKPVENEFLDDALHNAEGS